MTHEVPNSTAAGGPVARLLRPHLPRRAGRRLLFVGIYLLFLGALVWAGGKLFWYGRAGVPLSGTARVWDFHYPELRASGAVEAEISAADDRFDVLLLGGSVLDPWWGNIQALLEERLRAKLGDQWRVFNLARNSHTTRDSVLKYSQLADKQFDLVVVYHGINDVRMNACPAEMYREDYSHCGWYDGFAKRLQAGTITLPSLIVDEIIAEDSTIPRSAPFPEMLRYGSEIKTPSAFRKNLSEIIAGAKSRGEPLLLMTFASHIPDGYTRDRFDKLELGYALRAGGGCPAELWGEPQNVVATIAAHNEVIRELVAAHPDLLFVSQSDGIPRSGTMFVDPCHLSAAGCRTFVDNLWPVMEQQVQRWQER